MAPRKQAPPRLRISGVVAAMNRARQRLGEGIPAQDEAGFRQWVTGVIDEVEAICRKNHVSPKQLPAPSYRAYQFLKSIDLHGLPARSTGQPAAQSGIHPRQTPPNPPSSSPSNRRRVRVANLLKTVKLVQARLDELARMAPAPPDLRQHPQAAGLLADLHTTVHRVEEICRFGATTPSHLPEPSRRAYRWLKFLSKAEKLESHLAGLRLAIQAGRLAACRRNRPQVLVEFYHLPALYRTRVSRDAILVSASEGFITAPLPVLEALICSALLQKKDESIQTVRAYGDSDEYAEVMLALELEDEPGGAAARGRVVDLNEVFDRVNAEYFAGQMPRPRLTWNRTLTRRKLGHFQPATDTVMVSISLDHPAVPAYILDFVMYHELLHKSLGIHAINGRRYAHNKAFNDEERKFRRYAEAEKYLSDFFAKTWRT